MTKAENQSQGAQLHDWVSFLSVLNNNRQTERPFLEKEKSPVKMIRHLERALEVGRN